MIRNNNQNRRRRGGNNNNGPRPQQMGAGNNYGNRLDNRQRGNASQLLEKYRALARDAQQAGDRVTAEYYLQYADHYYRVLGDYRDKQPEQGRQRGQFYDDDSSGYAANADDNDDGDDDQDNDRSEDRGEARSDPRNEDRDDQRGDDNRSNWREERGNQGGNQNNGQGGGQNGNQPRERNFRDGNRDGSQRDGNRDNGQRDSVQRDNSQRDNSQRDGGQREANRDPGREQPQREQRRDGEGNRDRQGWNGNNANRNATAEREPRRERQERRPETPRTAEPVAIDEGPIPGLPGPATIRISRPAEPETRIEARVERTPRAPRREAVVAEPVLFEPPAQAAPETPPLAATVDGIEVVAPRRRGRPRKIVAEATAED